MRPHTSSSWPSLAQTLALMYLQGLCYSEKPAQETELGLSGRWEDVWSPVQEGGRDIRGGHSGRALGK